MNYNKNRFFKKQNHLKQSILNFASREFTTPYMLLQPLEL